MVPICQRNFGAVAQLGERHVRNVEVSGSIPLGSTKNLIFFVGQIDQPATGL